MNFISCEKIIRTSRKRRKFSCSQCVYVGLLILLVPSVFCDSGGSRRLTFESIFNSTNYAQLQHIPRPYKIPTHSLRYNLVNKTYSFEEDSRGNDVDTEDYDLREDGGGPLLVGFARDPYRYSVPEKDFLKGVRYMSPQTLASRGERGKRGVLELYNMMYCASGCDPLSYKGYGCYCGFLGSGRPTDGIDRCCKMHDKCYEDIYCPFFTVYFQPYYWKCYRGQPLCALENHDTHNQFINGCSARLCECDRQFAMCVKRYACPRRRALCRSSPIRLLQNLLMFK